MGEIKVGDDIYVREPQRYEPGCNSITGPVAAIDGALCTLDAYVAHPWVPGVGSPSGPKRITLPLAEVGHRGGTPISALSGRPGADGYAAFVEIAHSWGYP